MRAMMISALVFSGLLFVTDSVRAESGGEDCEVTCELECKQQASVCSAEVALGAKADRFSCETEANELKLECELNALESRAGCVGMCGLDARECLMESKAEFKECKSSVKENLTFCLVEIAIATQEARQACAEEAQECFEFCSDDEGGEDEEGEGEVR